MIPRKITSFFSHAIFSIGGVQMIHREFTLAAPTDAISVFLIFLWFLLWRATNAWLIPKLWSILDENGTPGSVPTRKIRGSFLQFVSHLLTRNFREEVWKPAADDLLLDIADLKREGRSVAYCATVYWIRVTFLMIATIFTLGLRVIKAVPEIFSAKK
jgi:hypothetical protein